MRKDFLVVLSDSGNVAVIEFFVDFGDSEVRHRISWIEEYQKSGLRRVSVNEFLLVDSQGGFLICGAVEQQLTGF